MAVFKGFPSDDFLHGTQFDDIFRLWKGGTDRAFGARGNDVFVMRNALGADDTINGGHGFDTVTLKGTYANLVLGADTLREVEAIELKGNTYFNITTNDANVAAGEMLIVSAGHTGVPAAKPLGDFGVIPSSGLRFDGSAETDGSFAIHGSRSADNITGGDQADEFFMRKGDNDTVTGGDGDDVFRMGGSLTASDTLNGGDGTDTLVLSGDYPGLTFGATTIANFESIVLLAGHSYNLTMNDANFQAGFWTVNAQQLGAGNSLTLNAAGETNTTIGVTGGGGGDAIRGGQAGDFFNLGGGADTYVYGAVGESSTTEYDTIIDANFDVDKFDLPVAVSGSIHSVSRDVSIGSFDSDMGAAISDEVINVITATGGDLIGHVFLVVDGLGGGGGYQAGQDYVFDITGYTGTLGADDFI